LGTEVTRELAIFEEHTQRRTKHLEGVRIARASATRTILGNLRGPPCAMATMLTLMNQDDGARRVDIIGLECGEQSPAQALSALGSTTFQEPVARQVAETHLVQDKRADRERHGHVKWSKEAVVPDVGGLGWRTKTGHLLKNQSYYPQLSKNTWDHPTFAGVNTWKEWHGPRMRADAEMMERLDRFDEEMDQWEAKKTFVNTTRVQTLDRFYGQKNQRSQLQSSASWAPHRHARREVHSSYETFDGTLDEKPSKVLKKVLTEKVLKSDREAIRQIATRMQSEETWKQVFKQMEQERRSDLRADLQQRQAHTDRLMQLSGQAVRTHLPPGQVHKSLNNCSSRTEELSKPRRASIPRDVTAQTDFRGLVHADNEHALEALFPGAGHELSVEFRARATASSQPGWPPPAPAETPRVVAGKHSREARLQQDASLTKLSIPSSAQRLEKVGTRNDPDQLKQHSKAQFLPTVAPPPPDQSITLLDED